MSDCTCEYPYPVGIWDGHHPNCMIYETAQIMADPDAMEAIAEGEYDMRGER